MSKRSLLALLGLALTTAPLTVVTSESPVPPAPGRSP